LSKILNKSVVANTITSNETLNATRYKLIDNTDPSLNQAFNSETE